MKKSTRKFIDWKQYLCWIWPEWWTPYKYEVGIFDRGYFSFSNWEHNNNELAYKAPIRPNMYVVLTAKIIK